MKMNGFAVQSVLSDSSRRRLGNSLPEIGRRTHPSTYGRPRECPKLLRYVTECNPNPGTVPEPVRMHMVINS